MSKPFKRDLLVFLVGVIVTLAAYSAYGLQQQVAADHEELRAIVSFLSQTP